MACGSGACVKVSDLRAAWAVVEQRWRETVARARRRPGAELRERVDGEWSFVQTVRHLAARSTPRS